MHMKARQKMAEREERRRRVCRSEFGDPEFGALLVSRRATSVRLVCFPAPEVVQP